MKNSFSLFVLLFILSSFAKASVVSKYKSVSYCISHNKEEYRVIRTFVQDSDKKLLIINSKTMRSFIISDGKYKKEICKNSKFSGLLQSSSLSPFPLFNDGIKHFKYGLYLTTDMCPSSKSGYEREFYKTLIKSFPNPVPVTVFVTKRWIKNHKMAFCELKRWQKEGKLDITWGNHTAYHFYKKRLALEQNFVLYKHEHFIDDVLELEKFLIEQGVIPSVFFRFPGLVSNKRVVQDVKKLSLITIGTDSWIAKNQKPKQGSIILVHGNKNESLGIKVLMKYFRQNKKLELFSLCDFF